LTIVVHGAVVTRTGTSYTCPRPTTIRVKVARISTTRAIDADALLSADTSFIDLSITFVVYTISAYFGSTRIDKDVVVIAIIPCDLQYVVPPKKKKK